MKKKTCKLVKELKILALDPSVMNRCGWAVTHLGWNEMGALVKEDWDYGSFEICGMNFKMRCHDLKDHLMRLGFDFDILVAEWPTYYSGEKGQVAAQQGYTINLAGIVMFIAGFFQVHHTQLFLYTAPDWKGTVKKAVTARRFFRLFGENEMKIDHDTIDAVMMLHYHLRKLGLIS